VAGSIYSADCRVDRPHHISITSYHTMKIHTLSVPTCGQTHSVRDFGDHYGLVALYLLTCLVCSASVIYKEHEERFWLRHPVHCNPDASVYTINPFRRMVTVGHNASGVVKNRRPTEREETAKWRLEGDMQCAAWY
jgi:hypothetical protein